MVVAEVVLYEVAGAVGRVTINRPERRNALTWDTVARLRAALAGAREDPAVRVVVLSGTGEKAFCAGADLAAVANGAAGGPEDFGALLLDLWALGKPTVARVRGYALAGGFGLAVACDIVVAADDAVFATPEIDVGLWPFVASVALIRAMPPRVALELMMTGRRLGAEEAARLGFVHRVVPVDQLDAAVDELAATLATKPPVAMRRGRDAFYATWGLDAAEAVERLHPLLTETLAGGEATEGRAAFAERRPPRWPVAGPPVPRE